MEIDKEKIYSKIQIIEDNLKKLKELKPLSFENFAKDFRNFESAKHLFQTAIEAMADIATHIIARLRLRTPESAVETIKILVENKVFPPENQKRYCEMIRFRNRLVHFYHKVDVKELYQILQNDLPDFEIFLRDLNTILTK
ncbi:MAG: DUF86 domain-containing protein [bacterium (Candidatus Ratteibacteria) CG_4_9_14_3_um_filter_41_21]|uniref:DUF86 domain-containing protein n=3 Tax=Candidatus Ratteibacteria TaxID=2979319 RepID=A0A2M7YFB6_9BACT|nr:MAG: DUF86 domain-containing protein [bacterium (Candidatus Ratteibacteria) CG01_land_8_20_14_3_00_40_19]PIW33596.1 MAG: DUF86 domain-containing protein [bacterium (Candidatus Ratteibacteria) CG15_BIG_FIL_POST_REV_8_21_14_020_41_12]PJA61671.1 MAG: DUF86 domain-containing protein [bacterium (Candidatus Ratteibacteria) CG_4_9_14_3_um_filter_41_21]